MNMNLVAITTHKSNYIPPVNHPWRKSFKKLNSNYDISKKQICYDICKSD